MRLLIAPEEYYPKDDDVRIFLAGGISNCEDWQTTVSGYLAQFLPDNVVIFNPRRESFDVSDLTASNKQISWEFDKLEQCDIFTMFFCNSPSVQPICMYELGRNLVRMKEKFPKDYIDRVVIGIEYGYSRLNDVLTQTQLAGYRTPYVYYKDIGSMYAGYAIDIINHYRSLYERTNYPVRNR